MQDSEFMILCCALGLCQANIHPKIYVYELPPSLNIELIKEEDTIFDPLKCTDFSHEGMGEEVQEVPKIENKTIRNTHQFSLEVIIHHKLLKSRFRTLNPLEADFFYVPAYVCIKCLQNRKWLSSFLDDYLLELEAFLMNRTFFREGKPHVSSLGKIHREMAGIGCKYLFHPLTKNITFLAIEKEKFPSLYGIPESHSIIVVPYPSYIHFTGANGRNKYASIETRDIFVLYPVGKSSYPEIRAYLDKQFSYKTHLSYEKYRYSKDLNSSNTTVDMVQILTQDCVHCGIGTAINVVSWMQHSVFCLQPPGDSPTRKSFYDSILCGCIPVIFIENGNPYAFSSILDYSEFSVLVQLPNFIDDEKTIETLLRKIKKEHIHKMQKRLAEISQFMQYSENTYTGSDAMELVLQELVASTSKKKLI